MTEALGKILAWIAVLALISVVIFKIKVSNTELKDKVFSGEPSKYSGEYADQYKDPFSTYQKIGARFENSDVTNEAIGIVSDKLTYWKIDDNVLNAVTDPKATKPISCEGVEDFFKEFGIIPHKENTMNSLFKGIGVEYITTRPLFLQAMTTGYQTGLSTIQKSPSDADYYQQYFVYPDGDYSFFIEVDRLASNFNTTNMFLNHMDNEYEFVGGINKVEKPGYHFTYGTLMGITSKHSVIRFYVSNSGETKLPDPSHMVSWTDFHNLFELMRDGLITLEDVEAAYNTDIDVSQFEGDYNSFLEEYKKHKEQRKDKKVLVKN